MFTHGAIQRLLTGMTERWMANVMNQRQSFHEINIQVELCGNSAGDLNHFNCMGEPVAEMVGITAGEDLGLCFQPPKCPGVNYAIAITLKIVAIGMRRLWMTSPAGISHR